MSNQQADKARSEKLKMLEAALGGIEKQYGKGSIMKMSDSDIKACEVTSTGCLSLDLGLGVGGVPKGRIIEIFGPESSGKTTISLSIIAQAQKAGGTVAFIDAEHALDLNYAKKLGVNVDDLLVSQPDCGEQALDITETLVKTGAIDVLVIDSVAALTPRAEIEGEMGDSHMGLQARLMSQALRKLTALVHKSNTTVIFINQLRMKIGVMFGNPETTTGGNALKFYASVRLDIRRVGAIKDGENVVGNRTSVKVVKNKMAPPFAKIEFDLMFGEGISQTGDVLDLAVTANMVEKSGAWYSYKGERLGQGRDQAKEYLKANPSMCEGLRNAILAKNGIGKMLLTSDMGEAVKDDASVEHDLKPKTKAKKPVKAEADAEAAVSEAN